MSPKVLSQLEKIAAARIQLLHAPIGSHFAFERGGFIILVERRGEGFGGIGAPGLLTEAGFAPLLNGRFVAKEYQRAATPEELASMRALLEDLKSALA